MIPEGIVREPFDMVIESKERRKKRFITSDNINGSRIKDPRVKQRNYRCSTIVLEPKVW